MKKNIIKTDKYLSLGTIVCLENLQKKVIIIGFCPVLEFNGEEQNFDYSGCLYPEGFGGTEKVLLFNHNQIDSIYQLGFTDEESEMFEKQLKEIIDNEKDE